MFMQSMTKIDAGLGLGIGLGLELGLGLAQAKIPNFYPRLSPFTIRVYDIIYMLHIFCTHNLLRSRNLAR